ncbi:hypothetical protein BT96DRAFT_193828 [Gymnopus androsaceus JB14]|uniref:Protein kinase domain-containing protein n=1 Tax=Gymnopus androsaceus JB14 TaxID=1447944 RepID=A0A6A4H8C3_9AGAR|nr:hypothetical protein BT96DRAFT_193828 [Gymnopus androsaceus JB14]
MATINDLPGIACVLPISTRLLIILYSTFSNLVQSLTLAIRLFMDDPGACLIHKEKILLVRDATVSLESLPDMYNAWSSTYRGRLKGECVSVKVWRGEGLSSPSRERTKFLRLEHELLVWREASMSHPNIAAVHGLIFALGNLPSVVTPYYRNGHINTYISKNPRTELKPLMINVAAGLQYLHQLSPPVSHGDVRGVSGSVLLS